MDNAKRGRRLRGVIVVLALGVAIGTMIVATPAAAHFRSSIDHIWSHVRAKADQRYLPSSGNLKPGKTFRGVYAAGHHGDVDPDFDFADMTFPVPLASAPMPHFIPFDGTAPPECPGSATAPSAQPGHLCVYESSGANRTVHIMDSPGDDLGEASRFGASVFVILTGTPPLQFYSRGSWAVTAP